MSRKKPKLKFNTAGGVIVMPRRMLESDAYRDLSPQAKTLMVCLQLHWRLDKPISFGIRQASEKIPCALNTAVRAFKALESRGFIRCENQSQFNSRSGSKTREWIITWMPYGDADQIASDDWAVWRPP